MQRRWTEAAVAGALLIAAVALFRSGPLSAEPAPMLAMDAMLFPAVLLLMMAAASLTTMVRAMVARSPAGARASAADHVRAAGLGILILAYALVLPRLGFLATTLVWTLAVPPLFTRLRGLRLMAFAIGTTVIVWAVFVHLLRTPLPRSPLGW